MVDYEKEDGTIEKKNVAMMMKHVLEDMFRRCSLPFFAVCPELIPYALFPQCRRDVRNKQSVREGFR